MATKKPEIGDKIEHTCNLNGTFQGKVIQMLATQFIYETDKARAKRKLTKTIIKTIQKRYYADMKHLREKYKKIKQRHHDGKLQ